MTVILFFFFLFFFYGFVDHRALHSFPTRRSSDLTVRKRFEYELDVLKKRIHILKGFKIIFDALDKAIKLIREDRKSTRLNSSHRCISYAVFCLKKKKKKQHKNNNQLYDIQPT